MLFFYGGDGATLLVAYALLPEIMKALAVYQANVQNEFDIYLRIGDMSVAHTYKSNQELLIAKASINALYTIPIVLGNGLHFAEKLIKSRDRTPEKPYTKGINFNLEGMECK